MNPMGPLVRVSVIRAGVFVRVVVNAVTQSRSFEEV